MDKPVERHDTTGAHTPDGHAPDVHALDARPTRQEQTSRCEQTSRRQFIQQSARKLAYAAPVVAALAAAKPGTAAASGSGS
jgi:hypothetical protein